MQKKTLKLLPPNFKCADIICDFCSFLGQIKPKNEKNIKDCAIYYLSADLQEPKIFKPRKKLSENAERAGWQGHYYDLSEDSDRLVRLL